MNIADYHQQYGSGTLHALMYTDGVILYVPGGRLVAKYVERLYLGERAKRHRSADGFTTAFIVRGEPCMRLMQAMCYTSDLLQPFTWTDNRDRDDDTIDRYLGLISQIGNGNERLRGNAAQSEPATACGAP
ncbi:MAG: hypothetical protein K2V38_06090 [Gemmataceae bacterium]|nr:hypothetical protein [Gemmataceae bacterium]